MERFDLTSSQRTTLTALVDEYQVTESPVKARTIAEETDRSPGTIRNQMRVQKSLGFVEGVSGPNGGYKPTASAYEALGRQNSDDTRAITLARNYERVTATVDEIDFTNVHHPDLCRARVYFQQSIRDFERGDAIVIGPSPVSNLVVGGEILAIDESANTVIVDVLRLKAPMSDGYPDFT